jgi:segregation and condensation protein A
VDPEEDDPRAELIRRLQEYEQFKTAALNLDELPRSNRDFWVANADAPVSTQPKPLPDVELQELLISLAGVLRRTDQNASHQIRLEPLSTRERMSHILARIQARGDQYQAFVELFSIEEGRAGVVVTFIAMLELIKESLIELVQTEPFAPIHIRLRMAAIVADNAEQNL